jgi:hypothetical protein
VRYLKSGAGLPHSDYLWGALVDQTLHGCVDAFVVSGESDANMVRACLAIEGARRHEDP